MTPDPDSAPDRRESDSTPGPLTATDRRAIEAAVAGAAGLLLGRVLFGKAGGLAAGLAAAGAGLLMKRKVPALQVPGPVAEPQPVAPADTAGVTALPSLQAAEAPVLKDEGPLTQMRLETGPVVPAGGWADMPAAPGFTAVPVEETEEGQPETVTTVPAPELTEAPAVTPPAEVAPLPESDAGVFAEEPAWFEELAKEEPEVLKEKEAEPEETPVDDRDNISFDHTPGPVVVELLPVATTDAELEEEGLTGEKSALPKVETASVPVAEAAVLDIPDLPMDFPAFRKEEAPEPREEFLIIPEGPSSYPPLQPVVAELNKSLEALLPADSPVSEASLPKPLAAETAPVAETDIEEPPAQPADSPFMIWKAPPVFRPVPLEHEEEEEEDTEAPGTSGEISQPSAAPVEDPEEIWRQAAVELSALRNAPPPIDEDPPWAAALTHTSTPVPLPPLPPEEKDPPPYERRAVGVPSYRSGEIPPWLTEIVTEEEKGDSLQNEVPPQKEVLRQKEASPPGQPFLPTIRLGLPQAPPFSPQSLVSYLRGKIPRSQSDRSFPL